MVKEAKAWSSLASKKMRLRPEPLHAPRATRQHAHPTPPKAHCPHANSHPCGQGAGDCGPSPSPPPPSCCMTSAHVSRDSLGMYVVWGLGGWGSKKALPLVLALPGGTHPLWKLGAHGALETLLGWSARPRGGRQETKMASGGLVCHRCRDLPLAGAGRWTWLSCHTHKEGCTLPTSGGAARALVC